MISKTKNMLKVEEKIGELLEIYLPREYINNKKTFTQIGEKLGYHEATIGKWLKLFGYLPRNQLEANLNKSVDGKTKDMLEVEERTGEPIESTLHKKYIEDKETIRKIGEELNISRGAIRSWLDHFNIPVRTISEANKGRKRTRVGEKTPKMLEVEERIGELLEIYLPREYINNKKSIQEIAKELDVSYGSVGGWMKNDFNIPIKNPLESREERTHLGLNKGRNYGIVGKDHPKFGKPCSEETKNKISEGNQGKIRSEKVKQKLSELMSGENNPNFNNWSSLESYPAEFIYIMANYIRERDNHQCQVCGKTEAEEGKAMSVHHVDYEKENSSEFNLISLCAKDHAPTNNKDRETWTELFFEKIKGIYGNLSNERLQELANYQRSLEQGIEKKMLDPEYIRFLKRENNFKKFTNALENEVNGIYDPRKGIIEVDGILYSLNGSRTHQKFVKDSVKNGRLGEGKINVMKYKEKVAI